MSSWSRIEHTWVSRLPSFGGACPHGCLSSFLHVLGQRKKSFLRIRHVCANISYGTYWLMTQHLRATKLLHILLTRNTVLDYSFVMNEGEDVSTVNSGIFISSIIPGELAERAGKMKPGISASYTARDAALRNCPFLLRCLLLPGGQIVALNHIGLEGFAFNIAVRMVQNSLGNLELMVSQPKGTSEPG